MLRRFESRRSSTEMPGSCTQRVGLSTAADLHRCDGIQHQLRQLGARQRHTEACGHQHEGVVLLHAVGDGGVEPALNADGQLVWLRLLPHLGTRHLLGDKDCSTRAPLQHPEPSRQPRAATDTG